MTRATLTRWGGRAGGRPFRIAFCALLVAGASSGMPVVGARAAVPSPAEEAPADTAGTALVDWAYDSWTEAWVQVGGSRPTLAPGSHATLMVLACQTADLERERLARHLTADECEHRMAAIRADQDSAVIVRLDLRVTDTRQGDALLRPGRGLSIRLEDDRGRQWTPVSFTPGPAVPAVSGLKLVRSPYTPPWLRTSRPPTAPPFEVAGGDRLTLAEHIVRFPRRDRVTGEPVVTGRTRWLRVRLTTAGGEWVSTWVFRADPGSDR